MGCDVWLEIADENLQNGGHERAIAVRWQAPGLTGAASVRFSSPFTAHTEALLRSYVRQFRSWRAEDRDRGLTAERTLLTLGRALGNQLVDDAYRFLSFCEWLERHGSSTLHVAVVSDDPALQELAWESLILPDAAYVLSAAAGSFVRAPAGVQPLGAEPVRLELGADPERQLRYLRLDSEHGPAARAAGTWQRLGWQGALHYRVARSLDVPPTAAASHIVHWSGAITQRDGNLYLTTATGELEARAFVAQLQAAGARLLILEPSSDGSGADGVAQLALRAGLDNVLVLSEATDLGWPSDWTERLLQHLGAGLGLRQAVVETRKSLQKALIDARQAEPQPPHAPQQWHALRHYSTRDVTFFASPQPLAAFEATEEYAALRRNLFGFHAAFLPPQAPSYGDRAALALRRMLEAQRCVAVHAPPGGGLTHALHRSALLLQANADVTRSYYWDFASDTFTARDVLEMIAGARGETRADQVEEAQVLASLGREPELLVFDNLDTLLKQDAGRIAELLELVERIAAAGGLCLLGTHAELSGARCSYELPRLSEVEAIALVQASAPQALALGRPLLQLLDALDGHPLLIRRLSATCTPEDIGACVDEARREYGPSVERAAQLDSFFTYRWQQLEPHWQQLASAWLFVDGLYLQFLRVAVDRPAEEQSESGRALWHALGAPADESCAHAIERLQRSGFAVTAGAGACIDQPAARFLQARAQQPMPQDLGLALARLVCEGTLRILERRDQTIADALTQHLLQQRDALVRQVELIARAGEHPLAVRTFLRLHELLLRAKLAAEAAARARALLELIGPEPGSERALGAEWLGLALRAEIKPVSGALERGVQHFAARLESGSLRDDAAQRALLPLTVGFLQRVYDQTGDYAAYRSTARRASAYYREIGQTPALVQQLLALAAAEHVLGNGAARDGIEHELLHELAFGEEPAGVALRQRTLSQLAAARLRRADHAGAQAIVEQLEREGTAGDQPTLLTLRAELALNEERWELAAQLFCALWQAAMSGKQGVEIDAVVRRLHELETRLGRERFEAVYALHAGSTPTPAALGIGRPDGAR